MHYCVYLTTLIAAMDHHLSEENFTILTTLWYQYKAISTVSTGIERLVVFVSISNSVPSDHHLGDTVVRYLMTWVTYSGFILTLVSKINMHCYSTN